MKLFKCVFIASLIAVLLSACATKLSDPLVDYQGQSAGQIYRSAKESFKNKNYAHAIKHYEALDVIYPFNPYSEQAQLELIYSYYQEDDTPSAKATAERFIHVYPSSKAIDYAYYMRALADMEQDRGWYLRYVPVDISMRDPGSMREAYQEFEQLINRYPNSPYAPDARQRMIYLRNLLANYELHIANYYFKKEAYVAAANRANEVLQNYPGAPEVEQALIIMIKSYKILGLNDLADKSLMLLKLNFPNALIK